MTDPRHDVPLILFESIRKDEIFCRLSALPSGLPSKLPSGLLSDPKSSTAGLGDVFCEIQRALIKDFPELMDCGFAGSGLKYHFCKLLAAEDNVFARLAEMGAFETPGSESGKAYLLRLAAREIGLITPVYHFDFTKLENDAGFICFGNKTQDTAPMSLTPLQLIHEAMENEDHTAAALSLARYYSKYGCGNIGLARAFIANENGLIIQPHIDPVAMEDIVGYESQKQALVENIEILLSGYTANNILLYGDSGTGKSSSVKALLNSYADKGLKLISVPKDKLHLLPDIFEKIRGRGMKFIVFIDDLSFEENEYEFKAFKSIIEGRVAPKPKNAIFIVTTNRRNIVKESWSEREGQDDVRRRDNIEEKRSLSDRFGITLIYSAPNKAEYLAIVRSIAKKAGLLIDDNDLISEALKWEIRHSGRSGRTARQFVDFAVGMRAVRGKEAAKEEKKGERGI